MGRAWQIVFLALLTVLTTRVHGQCNYTSLLPLIPANMTTDLPVGGQVNSSAQVALFCNDTKQITNLGKKIYVTCINGTNFTGVPPNTTTCRNPGNCTAYPPKPPAGSGLGQTNSTVTAEGDVATYYCTNQWYKVNGISSKFELACSAPNGTFPANMTWPKCMSTIPPPPPCKCLGDSDVTSNASKILLNNFCRNISMPGYLNPPSKKRCGTTDLKNPTADNICFCDSVDEASNQSYWFTIRLLTAPWEWMLDYSTKTNTSFLTQTTSQLYAITKAQIEKAIDEAITNSSISTGYVQSYAPFFSQGAAVPKDVFPRIKPATTTTTMPTTTTAGNGTTAAASATNATTPSTATTANATTTNATATNSTGSGRKKRQATFNTYTYINVLVNAQFASSTVPTASSFAAFVASLGASTGGRLTPDVKIDLTCPSTVCNVANETMKCPPTFLSTVMADYDIVTKYGVFNASDPNTTLPLDAGDLVELSCKQSIGPTKYPLIDNLDSDSKDHLLVTYCMYPDSVGARGLYNLEKNGVPKCIPICTDWLPTADLASNLTLVNISPIATPKVMYSVKNMTYDSNFFLFAGDKLVYECIENQTTVYGGTNKSTSYYGCTADGIYNVPEFPEPWPRCEPEVNIVISGVLMKLNWYDSTLSDRYKLIEYRDSDNMAKVVEPINYFTNVSIPVFIGLIVFILICCCCTSAGSPICRLCESKA